MRVFRSALVASLVACGGNGEAGSEDVSGESHPFTHYAKGEAELEDGSLAWLMFCDDGLWEVDLHGELPTPFVVLSLTRDGERIVYAEARRSPGHYRTEWVIGPSRNPSDEVYVDLPCTEDGLVPGRGGIGWEAGLYDEDHTRVGCIGYGDPTAGDCEMLTATRAR